MKETVKERVSQFYRLVYLANLESAVSSDLQILCILLELSDLRSPVQRYPIVIRGKPDNVADLIDSQSITSVIHGLEVGLLDNANMIHLNDFFALSIIVVFLLVKLKLHSIPIFIFHDANDSCHCDWGSFYSKQSIEAPMMGFQLQIFEQ